MADDNGFAILAVSEDDTTISGVPVSYPVGTGQIVSHLVEVSPGGQTGVHQHPVPCYMHVIDGTLTLELPDGTRREFSAGESFLEDPNSWVNNLNLSDQVARFLAVIPNTVGTAPIDFE